jgi:hypothetical protein
MMDRIKEIWLNISIGIIAYTIGVLMAVYYNAMWGVPIFVGFAVVLLVIGLAITFKENGGK